jgi:hypothetical protein
MKPEIFFAALVSLFLAPTAGRAQILNINAPQAPEASTTQDPSTPSESPEIQLGRALSERGKISVNGFIKFDDIVTTTFKKTSPVRENFKFDPKGYVTIPSGPRDLSAPPVRGYYTAAQANADYNGSEVVLTPTKQKNVVKSTHVVSLKTLAKYRQKLGSNFFELATAQSQDLHVYKLNLKIGDNVWFSNPEAGGLEQLRTYATQLFTFKDDLPTIATRHLGDETLLEITFTATPQNALRRAVATASIEGDLVPGARPNPTPFHFESLTTLDEAVAYELKPTTTESGQVELLLVKNGVDTTDKTAEPEAPVPTAEPGTLKKMLSRIGKICFSILTSRP